jgi:hypothetical protein
MKSLGEVSSTTGSKIDEVSYEVMETALALQRNTKSKNKIENIIKGMYKRP